MSTLISAYDVDRNRTVCDELCYDSPGPECLCICNGLNHGVGLVQALRNIQQRTAEIITDARDQLPRILKLRIHSFPGLTLDVVYHRTPTTSPRSENAQPNQGL